MTLIALSIPCDYGRTHCAVDDIMGLGWLAEPRGWQTVAGSHTDGDLWREMTKFDAAGLSLEWKSELSRHGTSAEENPRTRPAKAHGAKV